MPTALRIPENLASDGAALLLRDEELRTCRDEEELVLWVEGGSASKLAMIQALAPLPEGALGALRVSLVAELVYSFDALGFDRLKQLFEARLQLSRQQLAYARKLW